MREVDHGGFLESLKTGFIDASIESDDRFSPHFLVNDPSNASTVLSVLKAQMRDCDRFDFSVAFVTSSGLQTILELLNGLRDKGVPGRILTTTYLNFNDPDALRSLLAYPNIETRVFQGDMHAKGYFFGHGDINTIIVGSANMTQKALTTNKEWSVLLHSFTGGEMLRTAFREFDLLWNAKETVVLSESWVAEYERFLENDVPPKAARSRKSFVSKSPQFVQGPREEDYGLIQMPVDAGARREHDDRPPIVPNDMQESALISLRRLHAEGEERALLISATGTGKTYLSAFDVGEVAPKRILYVAHRDRILNASRRSFERVLGRAYTYGKCGSGRLEHTTCVFAMVSTLVRHLEEYAPDEFDYIIIDEAHRSGAVSYQKILEHFTPKFTLGMTATPNRTDGYDIYELFNHVIAYRITLNDALENDMLVPFHYFGIADLAIDGESQDDLTLFNRLTSDARVEHIISKIEEYSVEKHGRKGLVFCSRVNESEALSDAFNKRGYRTRAINGKDSDSVRDSAIGALESGELDYLFSVDILNEGVDIPAVNQIIMLRPTESAIVFIQQLGRGLRLSKDKEYTLVLDFIGNYQQNYLIPIALSNDRTYNKDSLRKFVKEGSSIVPGCSTVDFDRVSEGRIFKSIDRGSFGSLSLIKNEYRDLKLTLGRIPTLRDFDNNDAIDPLLIFEKCGSYHAFLAKHDPDYKVVFEGLQERMLRYFSQKLASGKRADELALVKYLIETGGAALPSGTQQHVESVVACLANTFTLKAQQEKTFKGCVFVEKAAGGVTLSKAFRIALEDPYFKAQILELIDFGMARNRRHYSGTYEDTPFVLYGKYTYEDVARLLHWEKNPTPLNVSGYQYDRRTNTFPVYINYEKDPNISDTIRYEDRFISDRELIAISKQPRTLDSPEIVRLREIDRNGMRVYLFVRKNKDDSDGGKEFYFLGRMRPTQRYEQFTMANTDKTAVEITYRLDTPVRPDIYDYLTSRFEDE